MTEITTQILLNLLIAFVWMLLNESWNVVVFGIGYSIGFIIILLMRRFFPERFYGRKIISIIKLFSLFIIELFKSSFVVFLQVTRPKLNIQPGIFRSETVLKTNWEITMLTTLLTLTPGSVVMEIDPKAGVMFIHAMDVTEFRNGFIKTKQKFEKAIIEVMR
ncbi:Na+/H+ antiporter subunit E [Paenibacillus eucommiae]|uniref:Multicomponent Na+:H+ antiporter subunit E n=1 Tax=Paenibacillus eucommiae TaxID=1355755 RepID=A0ABS4JAS8_9BACL|nr:Na+/H+ antiporter subunit E [Paenibacillus eucommiae]MBP1996950.1 multicomponent Na+:H+ antiporter subunit E [Paenibacillus eucommiae]